MTEYYDRDGQPIADMRTWGKLLGDPAYKRVAETTLPSGVWISTVWLGVNHSYDNGPPLIFESMAFDATKQELDCDRYSTEADAVAGHQAMVEKLTAEGR